MQQAGNDALFLKIRTAGEIERVDAAERVIGRVPHQLLNRIHYISIGGLPQRGEQGFSLAHALKDGMRDRCREEMVLVFGGIVAATY